MVQFDIQEQILEKLNALIVVLNRSGQAEYISSSAATLLGFKSEELLGSSWWKATRFSVPEGEEARKKILKAMREGGDGQTFEHMLRTSHGRTKWIRWNVSMLNEDQIVGIGYDITEKKNQEKQLLLQNQRLQQQNSEIRDSIRYARRIQESSLQSQDYIRSVFRQSFVFYKPKDIVSGDFYFFHQDEESKYAIAVDCTGHGVPGAMMSLVANSIIREVLVSKKIRSVSHILYELDKELYKAINSYGTELSSDGMDVALIRVNKKSGRLHFAGAFRPLIIVRGESVIEMKGSRFPLGFYSDVEKVFEEQVTIVKPGDQVYLFSDGFADQFGGTENRKLNRKNFREILKLAASLPVEEQEAFLDYSLNNWKQEQEQTDDVLVMGIRF